VPFLIDLFILLLVGAGMYVEIRRGLFFAMGDVVRIVCATGAGLVTYSFFHELLRSYAVSFIAFGVAALVVIWVLPLASKLTGTDPAWGRTALGRAGAGGIGLVLGLIVAAVFVPFMGRGSNGSEPLRRSVLARPFVQAMPSFYYLADRLNLDLPMIRPQAAVIERRFGLKGALIQRINYSRLNRSTCIRCRGVVHFDGYFNHIGMSVSPRFTCPDCGRTSDGCQTFEGFHKMYGRCPVEAAEELGPIDCGVWTNNLAVCPEGVCPVCGRSFHQR
jgi:hypothetical protein